jgi:hypothetical protein
MRIGRSGYLACARARPGAKTKAAMIAQTHPYFRATGAVALHLRFIDIGSFSQVLL